MYLCVFEYFYLTYICRWSLSRMMFLNAQLQFCTSYVRANCVVSWKIRGSTPNHPKAPKVFPPVSHQMGLQDKALGFMVSWWFRNPKAKHRLDGHKTPVNHGINYQLINRWVERRISEQSEPSTVWQWWLQCTEKYWNTATNYYCLLWSDTVVYYVCVCVITSEVVNHISWPQG